MALSEEEQNELEILRLKLEKKKLIARKKKEQEISKGESFLKGTQQGATFGFADELGGAIQSGLDKVSGIFGESPSEANRRLLFEGFSGDIGPVNSSQVYEVARDENRKDYAKAQAANPKTYLGGNIVGGVTGALAPGAAAGLLKGAAPGAAKILGGVGSVLNAPKGAGILRTAASGTAQGALSGVGNSEEQNIGGMARDAALGAGVGSLAGGLGGVVGSSKIPGAIRSGVGGGVLGGIGGALLADSPEDRLDYALKGAGIGAATGALGYGAARLGAAAIPKAAGAASKYFQPGTPRDKTALLAAAKELGLDVTPGMLDDSGVVARLESYLAKSPNILTGGIKKAQREVVEGLETAASGTLDDASSLSPYQLGDKFKSGLTAKVSERQAPISAVFDEVAEETKNIPISPRALEAVKRNIEKMDVYQLTGGAGKPGMYANMVPRFKNVNQVKTALTLLNNDIGSAQGAEKQVLLAIKDKLRMLEDNWIMRGAKEAAEGSGLSGDEIGEDIVGSLKEARGAYRELAKDLGDVAETARVKFRGGPSGFLDNVEAIPNEKIQDKFFNTENLRQLQSLKEKFPEEFDLLRSGRLKEISDASVDNSLAGGGNFSTQRFLKEVRKLNPEAQEMLFGENVSKIRNVETVQRAIPKNFNPSGTASEQSWGNWVLSQGKDLGALAAYKALSGGRAQRLALKLESLAKSSPESFGQFSGAMKSAAERGPQAVSATNFVLQQTRPEYREIIRKIAEETDNEEE